MASPPARRQNHVTHAVLAAATALLLAALLDADALQQTARTQPFGWRHDVAGTAVRPVVDVAVALHLTAPRRWLEEALDRPDPGAPTTTTTTTTTTSVAPSTTPTSGLASTTTATTTLPEFRHPTPSAPLRVLVAGDSMTEAFGPAMLDLAESTGVVDATHDLRYSSGLTRPDYFDWPGRLATLVRERNPEACVVMLGANDAQGIQTAEGPKAFGSPAWIAEYQARVAATMQLLDDRGRVVFWIGLPVMRSSGYDGRMQVLNAIYRDEAALHAGVRYLDTRALFSINGGYSAYLPDSDGHPVLMRREDGIHLTPAGGMRLARTVMAAIGRDWRISET